MAGIVVGVDGSMASRHAVDWAAAEAALRGTELLLLECWRDPVVDGFGFTPMYPPDLFVQDIEAALEGVVGEVLDAHPGLVVSTALIDGYPARTLVDRAAEADLLVVGARGRGGFLGLELGSVSTKAARRSPVPIVVVRGEPDRAGRPEVVVGVDGSESSRQALRWAAGWAGAHDRTLVVLMAWNYLQPIGPFGPIPVQSEYEPADALKVLEAVVADVLGPDAPVRIEVVSDLPARAILDRADDACLIVVGRHGIARWAPPELGATAIQVLHHAACPVAVVPEQADDDQADGNRDG